MIDQVFEIVMFRVYCSFQHSLSIHIESDGQWEMVMIGSFAFAEVLARDGGAKANVPI